MNSTIKMLIQGMVVLVALLWGCNPQPPTCKIQTQQADAPGNPYFGIGDTISVEAYDHIGMRPGDTITLAFPCNVSKPLTLPDGYGCAVKGKHARLWCSPGANFAQRTPHGTILPNSNNPADIIVSFPSPQYQLTIYTPGVNEVWPGDANADGRRNMLDLYAIAQGIKQHRQAPSACTPPTPLSYPPTPGGSTETSATYDVCPWGNTFVWDGRNVDFSHADCNLDGKIDGTDVEYLASVLDPMYLPQFLQSPIHNIELQAHFPSATGLQPEPVLQSDGHFALALPFDIEIVNTNGTPVPNIMGIAFERPIAETAQYRLIKTEFLIGNSLLFSGDSARTVWQQRFWGDFALRYQRGACADATDRVLDVGAFRLSEYDPSNASSLCAGQCLVTLDDILQPILADPTHSFDVMQHIVNGVVFVNNHGVIEAQAVECTSDSAAVSLPQICKKRDVFLRDGTENDPHKTPTPAAKAFMSPDIWVRHANADLSVKEHQEPENGGSEIVFVRVFNQGCDTVREAQVEVHWAPSSTFLQGADFVPNLIGNVVVPVIPPFESAIVRLPWTPRLPRSSANDCNPMISIVAEIYSPSDNSPGLTSNHLEQDVLGSNNMAMRNTAVIPNGKGNTTGQSCVMMTLEPPKNRGSVQLHIVQISGPTALPASHYGDLSLTVEAASITATIVPTNLTLAANTNATYLLDAGALAGTLDLGASIAPGTQLELGFQLRNPGGTMPILNRAVPYQFQIYATIGTTEYCRQVVELYAQ